MGCFMIWKVLFQNKEAKKWFEEKYNFKPIHHHYEKELGLFCTSEFYYTGYFGYGEAECERDETKKNGVLMIHEFLMCDNDKAFEDVDKRLKEKGK